MDPEVAPYNSDKLKNNVSFPTSIADFSFLVEPKPYKLYTFYLRQTHSSKKRSSVDF